MPRVCDVVGTSFVVALVVVTCGGCDPSPRAGGSSRTPRLTLARSTAHAAVGDALAIDVVTDTEARIEDRSYTNDLLAGVLSTYSDRARRIAALNPSRPFRGDASVAIGANVLAHAMRSVLRALAASSYTRVTLVVAGRGGRRAGIALAPLDRPDESELRLAIRLRGDGVHVCGSGGCLEPGCTRTTNGDTITMSSTRSLGPCLTRVRAELSDARTATIDAADAVPFQDVVRALDETLAIFPEVHVAR